MKEKCEVRLLPQAREDFLEHIDFIAQGKPSAANKMVDRFEHAFELLAKNPFAGRQPGEKRLQLLRYRYLIIGSYFIFYRVQEDKVFIYRIFHAAQDYLKVLLME
jgi:toxin ParE1/3/4